MVPQERHPQRRRRQSLTVGSGYVAGIGTLLLQNKVLATLGFAAASGAATAVAMAGP